MENSYNNSNDRPYRPRFQDQEPDRANRNGGREEGGDYNRGAGGRDGGPDYNQGDQGQYDGNRSAPAPEGNRFGRSGYGGGGNNNRSHGNGGGYGNRRRPEPRDEVYSKQVRAGKRRYFFDVRDTRFGDFYLTITEMKRGFEGEQPEKHKLFLYKEDFTKFVRGLQDTVDYIKTNLLSPDQLDDLERGDAQYEEDERRWQEERQARDRDRPDAPPRYAAENQPKEEF